MSDAPTIAIAELVRASLAAAELSTACEVERVYDTETSLNQLETLDRPLLSVLPIDAEEDVHGRDRIDGEYRVLIAVRRKLSARTAAVIDPLVALAEEIKTLFLARRVGVTRADPVCTKAALRVFFSPKILREHGVYFGVVELTYYGQTGVGRP